MRGFKDSNAFPIICRMPAGLKHWDQAQPYDPAKSEVVQWLIQQPEVLQYIFNKATTSKAITFDPETQTWKGSGRQ